MSYVNPWRMLDNHWSPCLPSSSWGHDCYRCLVPCYAQQDPQRILGRWRKTSQHEHQTCSNMLKQCQTWSNIHMCHEYIMSFQAPGASENSIFRNLSSSVCDLSCCQRTIVCCEAHPTLGSGFKAHYCTSGENAPSHLAHREQAASFHTATHRFQSQSQNQLIPNHSGVCRCCCRLPRFWHILTVLLFTI